MKSIDQLKVELRLDENTKIKVITGEEVDINSLPKSLVVPKSRKYRYIRYKCSKTQRWSQVFICDNGCGKLFRKWHNLFDHMRIHSKEKPFYCPILNKKKMRFQIFTAI